MVLTALIMGLTGSLHCVGMCSPLAMAVGNMNTRAFLNRVIYNAGRIVTYGLLGVGDSGSRPCLSYFKISKSCLCFIRSYFITCRYRFIKSKYSDFVQCDRKANIHAKKTFYGLFSRKNFGSVFLLGTLNGILPCGLVWIALTYSFTLQSAMEGFSFMILFGIGTLPVMLGFTSVITQLLQRFNFNFQRITSAMLILSGILLIVRVFIIHLPHQHSLQQGVVDIVLCNG